MKKLVSTLFALFCFFHLLSEIALSQLPGEGDYIIRAEIHSNGTVTFYLSISQVAGSRKSPFYMCNFENWNSQPLSASPLPNWWMVNLPMADPGIYRFAYGGDLSANSWASMENSEMFFDQDPGQKNLYIVINQGAVIPGKNFQFPEMIQLRAEPEIQQDNRIRYPLKFWAGYINDWHREAPFWMHELEEWNTIYINDSDQDGFYEGYIDTFDRGVALTYGGNPGSYVDITKSKYFVMTKNTAVVEFFQSTIRVSGGTWLPPPGQQGDSFIRFGLDGNRLTMYYDLTDVNGPLTSPFHRGNYFYDSHNAWDFIPMKAMDARGWAAVTIIIIQPAEIMTIYGGRISPEFYASVENSEFFDPKRKNLHFKIQNGVISPYHHELKKINIVPLIVPLLLE